MKTSTAARAKFAQPPRAPTRRSLMAGLGAVGATLLLPGAPAGAAAPLGASMTAKKVAGQKVRTTVKATLNLPGLKWSGTLGTWDVPEGGKRQVSTQPPGVPARFDLMLSSMMNNMMFMQMMMMQQMMGGGWAPGPSVQASAPVA